MIGSRASFLMPKCLDQRIALVALIGFAAWLFVGLPLLYLPGGKMIDWGTVPQWLTGFIAGGALIAAAVSITSQREIARKRAATDFFLKTEMDHETLESHKEYIAALEKLASAVEPNGLMQASFDKSDEYWEIRDYLNLHELMAVGIRRDVFDDRVCRDFWEGEMRRAYRDAMPLIKFVQAQPGQSGTYIEMVRVAEDWEDKRKRGIYS
jgi:Domain of unknown function (DUF4760)